jgi:hypothetical protein
VEQAERLGGIGDLLEDDLEQLHQTSKKNYGSNKQIKKRPNKQDITRTLRQSCKGGEGYVPS